MTTMSPISPQPQDTRPRAQTAVSYTSHRSRRSSGSSHRIELTESAKDKKRLNTKADPSKALNEATPGSSIPLFMTSHPTNQPRSGASTRTANCGRFTVDDAQRCGRQRDKSDSSVAVLDMTRILTLATADPDRSNPTRSRMERPLDTIRAFNAAAEGTSSRRSSFNNRPPSQVGWNNDMNRRGSYYSSEYMFRNPQLSVSRTNLSPDNGYSPQRQRPAPGGGYYRNSSYGFGPQSSVEEEPGSAQMHGRGMRQFSAPEYAHHNGYQNGHQYGPQNGPQHAYSNGHQNGYPGNGQNNHSPNSTHSYQHSHETITSGSDEYGKSTNPSSQNSSFDQLHQLRKHDDFTPENPYANDIKFNQFTPTKPFAEGIMQGSPYGPGAVQPPLPPTNGYPTQNNRQPMKLNSPTGDDYGDRPTPPPKRQSWIKRRFSRRET